VAKLFDLDFFFFWWKKYINEEDKIFNLMNVFLLIIHCFVEEGQNGWFKWLKKIFIIILVDLNLCSINYILLDSGSQKKNFSFCIFILKALDGSIPEIWGS